MKGPLTRAGRAPPFRASVPATCPSCATAKAISRDARRVQCCGRISRRGCSSLRQHDAKGGHGPSCNKHGKKGQRGDLVYRADVAACRIKDLSTCRAQRGRSCERAGLGGGGCSLIGWASGARKKILTGNVASAETLVAPFSRADIAFMPYSAPEVTQLARAAFFSLKASCMTIPMPHRPPWTRWRCPDPHQEREKHAHGARRFIARAACSRRHRVGTL